MTDAPDGVGRVSMHAGPAGRAALLSLPPSVSRSVSLSVCLCVCVSVCVRFGSVCVCVCDRVDVA